jgi:hypothetical protein
MKPRSRFAQRRSLVSVGRSWLSDVVLFDSRTAPPTWDIRLEALVSLNPAGHQCWQEVCTGIEQFLQEQGLTLAERPFEVVVNDDKS